MTDKTLTNAALEEQWKDLVKAAEYATGKKMQADEWSMTRIDFQAILWANDNLKPKEQRTSPHYENGDNGENGGNGDDGVDRK